ncbi:uncharacterized protein FTJAE_5056 [Fusarium tjaetaba]|uniref:Uncharacterized protein n=1 Tax=Fusarium tjaetaba TaxID=1567544 RepID=A0A8H5RTX1_9HYPO|nr:uncharacterized protein FTJAE_5056 [Fusarium tjaetaba]KAF5638985.1 hypothetical protein FTJAE_5056 [Fusarium tjaetaba]
MYALPDDNQDAIEKVNGHFSRLQRASPPIGSGLAIAKTSRSRFAKGSSTPERLKDQETTTANAGFSVLIQGLIIRPPPRSYPQNLTAKSATLRSQAQMITTQTSTTKRYDPKLATTLQLQGDGAESQIPSSTTLRRHIPISQPQSMRDQPWQSYAMESQAMEIKVQLKPSDKRTKYI